MARQQPAEDVPADTAVSETEPETVDGVLEERKDYPGVRSMLQILAMEATAPNEADDDFVMGIMDAILTASTADEVFAAQETGMMSGQDFAGRPFFLKTDDISIRRSTKDGGLPFYAMFKCVEVASGEEYTVNCGGMTFMAVLHALRQQNYFDATDEFPLGRSVSLVSNAAPAGAYLTLVPYRIPTAATASRGKK